MKWVIQECIDRQEAKVKCAFQEELDSGYMSCVPNNTAKDREYIKEIKEDENRSRLR